VASGPVCTDPIPSGARIRTINSLSLGRRDGSPDNSKRPRIRYKPGHPEKTHGGPRKILIKIAAEGEREAARVSAATMGHRDGAHRRMIGDILASPVLRGVFCEGRRFTFNPKSANLVRINRAKLGRFDALVLGLLLIAQFKGQLVLPKFGFYGRDAHMNLIEEDRLVAGINTLAELSPLLR
jgi:hypothetical protein